MKSFKICALLQYLLTMTVLTINMIPILIKNVNANGKTDAANFIDNLGEDLKSWDSFEGNYPVPEITCINALEDATKHYELIKSFSEFDESKNQEDPITVTSIRHYMTENKVVESNVLASILRHLITKENSIIIKDFKLSIHTIKRKYLACFIYTENICTKRIYDSYHINNELWKIINQEICDTLIRQLVCRLHDMTIENIYQAFVCEKLKKAHSKLLVKKMVSDSKSFSALHNFINTLIFHTAYVLDFLRKKPLLKDGILLLHSIDDAIEKNWSTIFNSSIKEIEASTLINIIRARMISSSYLDSLVVRLLKGITEQSYSKHIYGSMHTSVNNIVILTLKKKIENLLKTDSIKVIVSEYINFLSNNKIIQENVLMGIKKKYIMKKEPFVNW